MRRVRTSGSVISYLCDGCGLQSGSSTSKPSTLHGATTSSLPLITLNVWSPANVFSACPRPTRRVS